jgi:Flp pilus assembly protein TadB
MAFEKQILDKVVLVYPKKYRERYARMLILAGKKDHMASKLGAVTLLGLFAYLAVLFVCYIFFNLHFIYAIFGGLLLIVFGIFIDYLLLYFAVEDRKERIEKVLPDFLHLISSNVRAGYTPFQALKAASRDELGPLKDELDIATTKILGATSFRKAMTDMTKRVESPLLERVVHLFITSMQAGSHMADLMEETAQDIGQTRSLKNDLSAGTKNYQMFILFTVILGSPLLFSISLHLVGVISGMNTASSLGGDDSFGLGLMGGPSDITANFIFWISVFMIVSTSIFSAILIGVFKEGNKKYGLRYAPAIALLSLGIFMIAKQVIGSMF